MLWDSLLAAAPSALGASLLLTFAPVGTLMHFRHRWMAAPMKFHQSKEMKWANLLELPVGERC